MPTIECEALPKSSLWPEYRRAFAEFSKRVRQLQSLTSYSNPDPEALRMVSHEVEQARAVYNCQRDALTQHLLSSRRPASWGG